MTVRKRLGSALFVGCATALAVGLGATAAFAAGATTTWTVKPGGSYTAVAAKTILKDKTTGTELTCVTVSSVPASKAAGTLKSGSGLTNPIGKIASIAFNNCTGPLGLAFTVTVSNLPWHINALKYDASTGTMLGNVSGVHATLSGPSCSAVVDGTGPTADNGKAAIKHVNSAPAKLRATGGGDLHIYNVSGCAGLIASGDAAGFTATYTLNKAQTITSP
jgi:hypothetical protein